MASRIIVLAIQAATLIVVVVALVRCSQYFGV